MNTIMKIDIIVVKMIIRTVHSVTFAPLLRRLGDQDRYYRYKTRFMLILFMEHFLFHRRFVSVKFYANYN